MRPSNQLRKRGISSFGQLGGSRAWNFGLTWPISDDPYCSSINSQIPINWKVLDSKRGSGLVIMND